MSETVEAEWIIESGEHLLRLVLFRAGDRYAHRIEIRTPSGDPVQFVESMEGVPTIDPTARGLSSRNDGPVGLPAMPRDARLDLFPLPSDSADEDLLPKILSPAELTDRLSETWPASPPFQQFHDQEIAGKRAWFLVGMAGKSHWSASVTATESGWDFDVACRYRETPRLLGSTYRIVQPKDYVSETISWGVFNRSDAPGASWMINPYEPGGFMGQGPRLSALAAPPASARWRYVFAF